MTSANSIESYKKLFKNNEITQRQLQVLQILRQELGFGQSYERKD